MSTTASAFAGTVRYEFQMQFRRPAIWITVGAIALLILGTAFRGSRANFGNLSTPALEATVAGIGSYFLPIVFGILLADRLPRERRLGTTELLESLPVGDGLRLWGKYVGTIAATLVPLVVGYLALTAIVAFRQQDCRSAGGLRASLPSGRAAGSPVCRRVLHRLSSPVARAALCRPLHGLLVLGQPRCPFTRADRELYAPHTDR